MGMCNCHWNFGNQSGYGHTASSSWESHNALSDRVSRYTLSNCWTTGFCISNMWERACSTHIEQQWQTPIQVIWGLLEGGRFYKKWFNGIKKHKCNAFVLGLITCKRKKKIPKWSMTKWQWIIIVVVVVYFRQVSQFMTIIAEYYNK